MPDRRDCPDKEQPNKKVDKEQLDKEQHPVSGVNIDVGANPVLAGGIWQSVSS